MNTTFIIAEALLKYGPGVARGIAALFNSPAPSLNDWEAVFKLAEKSYDEYTKPISKPSAP